MRKEILLAEISISTGHKSSVVMYLEWFLSFNQVFWLPYIIQFYLEVYFSKITSCSAVSVINYWPPSLQSFP